MAYVPHWAGRALASRRSRTVGAIVPTLDIAIFARGIEAMEARLQQLGYSLLIASSGYDKAKEVRLVRTFIERGLDAIALVGADHDAELYRMLEAAHVPIVNTYVYDPAAKRPCVGIDHRQAAHRILRHLIDLGHREFGLVTTSPRVSDRTKARLDGMRQCLAEEGILLPVERIVEVPYSVMDGRAALRTLLGLAPEITAVACTSDVLAIGVMFEAFRRGISIPEALSVTGFDDLDLSSQFEPQLTTVHVPAHEIGQRTADELHAAMEGANSAVVRRVELPTSLILRSSSGRVQRRSSGGTPLEAERVGVE
jgi:LacI family transcriptional regulator